MLIPHGAGCGYCLHVQSHFGDWKGTPTTANKEEYDEVAPGDSLCNCPGRHNGPKPRLHCVRPPESPIFSTEACGNHVLASHCIEFSKTLLLLLCAYFNTPTLPPDVEDVLQYM